MRFSWPIHGLYFAALLIIILAKQHSCITETITKIPIFNHCFVTPQDIAWLKSITNLPILIKGILTREDGNIKVSADDVCVTLFSIFLLGLEQNT